MKYIFITILLLTSVFCFSQTDMSSYSNEGCIEDVISVNALATLRNQGNLTIGCTYEVTQDFGQCIGEITMFFHAVSENEISQDFSATKGVYNFSGRYDLDQTTNGFLELEDDRGNEVEGNVAIKRFPWESTRVINTKVEETATWLCDCFPNYNHYDNRHFQDSYVITTGATGYIYQTTFEHEARPTWTNSFINVDASSYGGNFACDCDNAVNYTSIRSKHNSSAHDYDGGVRMYFDRFDTDNLSIVRNDDADVQLRYGKSDESYLRFRSGVVQSYYSTFDSYTNMDKQNTGLTYIYMTNWSARARLINSVGALADRHYYSTYTSYADIDINNSDFYSLGNQFDSRANIDVLNCENFDIYYNNFSSLSRGEFNNNTGLTYIYGNNNSGNSEMRIENNNNGRFTYNRVNSLSLLRITGGTDVQVLYCSLDNASRQYYNTGVNSRNSTLGYAFLYADTNSNTVFNSIIHGRITVTTTANNANKTTILGVTTTNPLN